MGGEGREGWSLVAKLLGSLVAKLLGSLVAKLLGSLVANLLEGFQTKLLERYSKLLSYRCVAIGTCINLGAKSCWRKG
jgi:hypothetical protein